MVKKLDTDLTDFRLDDFLTKGGHDVKMKLTENGVKFRSPYDGSKHEFTPE